MIADKAEAQVLVRLVGDSEPVRAALMEAAGDLAEVDFTLEIPFVRLARGGGFADDDCEIHDRHSAAYELGRAVAAGAGFDSCGAHAV